MSKNSCQPAIFIDTDDTLIRDAPHSVDPKEVSLTPGAGAALKYLKLAGYALVVVGNQAVVARGPWAENASSGVECLLQQLLKPFGVQFDGFYFCSHDEQGVVPPNRSQCDCHKSKPGLLLRAAQDLHLNLTTSWVVGDRSDDIRTGQAAGCQTIFFTHYPSKVTELNWCNPDFVAKDFSDIVDVVRSELEANTLSASSSTWPALLG